MKKIFLIIIIAFCIFQMVVLAAEIDIGSAAINRSSTGSPGGTVICFSNPANESGIIDTIQIFANVTMVNVEVATFFCVSGVNYSTRDNHTIGTVTQGATRTFSGLNIEVEAGDYIGFYFTGGKLDGDSSGSGGRYITGDYIPCTNQPTSFLGDTSAYSVYGSGETVAAGWDGPFNSVTISKWNTKEIVKWNDLE